MKGLMFIAKKFVSLWYGTREEQLHVFVTCMVDIQEMSLTVPLLCHICMFQTCIFFFFE